VLTFRDANLDNEEFIEQYAAMDLAQSFDEFIESHRTYQGVPLFNTIAVGADGRTWYADTSATPNLSDEAEAAYLESVEAGGLAGIAAQNRVVLLDGSNSLFEWEESPGARDPGLVPFDEMPMTERTDYVFNANDSYWLSNAEELLQGSYSVLHGRAGVEQSWRTRQNAVVLSDTSATGPAGDDGLFTGGELRDLAFDNEGYLARALREPVVERCSGEDFVRVPDLVGDDGAVLIPAESVGIEYACSVLAAWDGRYDLDSVGAVLWREFVGQTDVAALWEVPFDPADPVNTPRGLAALPPETTVAGVELETRDPVLVGLARAVQVLSRGGLSVDVPLGDVQFTAARRVRRRWRHERAVLGEPAQLHRATAIARQQGG
jgi:acyl-homoserine-lactone acylase